MLQLELALEQIKKRAEDHNPDRVHCTISDCYRLANDALKAIELKDFNDCARAIDSLRTRLLFDYDDGVGMNRFAQQHFLTGLAAMQTAVNSMKLAWMEQLAGR